MKHDKIKELEQTIQNEYQNLAGLVVYKGGAPVYQGCFNGFTSGDAVHVYSVTKSIVSALVGIAIHKGYIKSVQQKVLEFFPGYVAAPGETLAQTITVQNLLTMTAPYKYETEPYESFFTSSNWVNFALDLLGDPKHTGEFLYSALVGVHILAGILVKATGKPLLDFARENLFSPLGICVEENIVFHNAEEQLAWYGIAKHKNGWVVDPQGINTAGWGLTLTAADMAKFGQLYLNGGVWNGKQIVPASWVNESTAEHSRWLEMNLPYGYLWWLIDKEDRAYAAMGDGGNVIYINPKKQMVVSTASLFMPDAKDRIELIKRYIEPIFEV